LNLKLATTSTGSSLYFDNTVGIRHRWLGVTGEFIKEPIALLDWGCIVWLIWRRDHSLWR